VRVFKIVGTCFLNLSLRNLGMKIVEDERRKFGAKLSSLLKEKEVI
jgi:hypothetical protein